MDVSAVACDALRYMSKIACGETKGGCTLVGASTVCWVDCCCMICRRLVVVLVVLIVVAY